MLKHPRLPLIYIRTDRRCSPRDIYNSMRDQACQNKCETLAGIPSDLMTSTKEGDTGCECAIKVSHSQELYFYTTNDGQNCYDATTKIIDNCLGSQQTGWLNGVNGYEFYQIGVRPLNDAEAKHDPFADDAPYLGHTQANCNVGDAGLWYNVRVESCNWQAITESSEEMRCHHCLEVGA